MSLTLDGEGGGEGREGGKGSGKGGGVSGCGPVAHVPHEKGGQASCSGWLDCGPEVLTMATDDSSHAGPSGRRWLGCCQPAKH